MTRYSVAVLPGDGIGPEITAQAVKVLKAIEQKLGLSFDLEEAPIGGAGIDSDGVPLPEKTLKLCQQAQAVFLGAIGDYKYDTLDPSIRPEQGLLQLRKAMDVYANLRPVKTYKALLHTSTLKPEVVEGIDILIVRELTSGLYFGQPRGKSETEGFDTMRYKRNEVERITKVAFELAQTRGKKLCSVDKANVLSTSQFWREIVEGIAPAYPDVELSHMYVDNASMQLIRNPRQFDVLLTENTFGDILSDEASMLSGSLGMLASASLGENTAIAGSRKGLYEPSHGSAPKYAGQNKVNPIATILSMALMLDYSFNLKEAAILVEQAVSQVLDAGYRTYDIVDPAATTEKLVGTAEMGDQVAQAVLQLKNAVAV